MPGFSQREIDAADYLGTLEMTDLSNVQRTLEIIYAILSSHTPFAVIAVGSSLKPLEELYHPVEDIDLRLLHPDPTNTDERQDTIDHIRVMLRAELARAGVFYNEANETTTERMVQDSDGGLVPYLDWYNADPSFKIQFQEGLPIHLSISGVDNYTLHEYLMKERRANSLYSLLLLSQEFES